MRPRPCGSRALLAPRLPLKGSPARRGALPTRALLLAERLWPARVQVGLRAASRRQLQKKLQLLFRASQVRVPARPQRRRLGGGQRT